MSQKPDQQELPFAQVEGELAERKNLLGLALLKVNANIYLAQLMVWIFNTTERSKKPLLKSYEQLAARPWGLCCSNSQAQATVRKAKRHGILRVQETWAGPGIQAANEYSIDWEGVRRIVLPNQAARQPAAGLTTSEAPLTTCDPGLTTSEAPLTTCDHTKENTFVPFLSPSSTRSNERPNALRLSPEEHRQRIASWLDREGVWNVPQLREAGGRRIAPLPPERLVLDAFQPLEQRHLTRVQDLARWFRRQLSLSHPLTGQSEAELLLVIAAGIAAAQMPANQVRSSRRGLFISTVARGIWRPVLWHVPAAADELAKLTAAYPACLTADEWPGPRAEDALDLVADEEAAGGRTQWRDGALIYTAAPKREGSP